ncbi:MAG: GNAT family N-acetyltransferase [Oscillospiraceae bacterium]|nr:GNAT family N-acetyltransferase [Oscillospiraceae bacterium]
MTISELCNFYDERFTQCFRAYFLEIGIKLKADTDVFDDIMRSYEKENMRTFVMEDGKQLAGFIMLQPEHLKSGFFEASVGFIRELWVTPSYRRRGYGKRLIEIAEDYFRKQEIYKLILTYDEDALEFYKRLGFHHDRSFQARNNGNVIVKYL